MALALRSSLISSERRPLTLRSSLTKFPKPSSVGGSCFLISDHRPYFIKQAYRCFEDFYSSHFLAPQLAALGRGFHFMKPWNIRIHGSHISIGENAHIVTARDRRVCLSTWTHKEHQGHINIGNQCLLCPGVRIDSASEIRIGDNCMIAAGAYLTDTDWHDLYDRTEPVGNTKPIILQDNVWVASGATICKGVSIGRNSIVAAASVVVADVAPNTIAAGSPAREVKQLDLTLPMVTRADLFEHPLERAKELDEIDRYLLRDNNLIKWIRNLLMPRQGD